MRISIDHKLNAKALELNANEASVLAAITKCSEIGKGWYSDYEALADALEFKICAKTVERAVKKLIKMGLVEKRQNVLYARTNCPPAETNCPEMGTNCPSPTPPINYINNMEVKENNARALSRTAQPLIPSFEDFLKAFGKGYTDLTKNSAEMKWNLCSAAKKIKLVEALNAGKWDKPRPDWCVGDFPEPEPEFLRGDEPGDLVQVFYQGKYKICERSTQELFNLQYVDDWKQKLNP